jgi:hypothetical protein
MIIILTYLNLNLICDALRNVKALYFSSFIVTE